MQNLTSWMPSDLRGCGQNRFCWFVTAIKKISEDRLSTLSILLSYRPARPFNDIVRVWQDNLPDQVLFFRLWQFDL